MQFEQLGPYRIERVVGRGGMGAVYAAQHVETEQSCAIKVLSGAIADDTHFRERFKGEVETLLTLQHPNIVRLIGYGEQDGRLFYAMELIDGCSLQDVLQERKLDWRETIGITVQVCNALKHAHDHGIIHRDLKPANLLVDKEGVIKLTDFGIAKAFGATQITAAGGIIGTADYMAPEQADERPITNRTDLYSLGCVMYAMLCRRPPFAGKSIVQILNCLKDEDPQPIRVRAPNTPQELNDIIMQLLEKEPAARIANAMLLAKQLQALEHGLSRTQEPEADDSGEYELAADPNEDKGQTATPGTPTAARPTVDVPTVHRSPAERTASSNADGDALDETVVTHGQHGATGSDGNQSQQAPQTHFVTVEEKSDRVDSPRRRRRGEAQEAGPSQWLSIVGLVAMLILIVGAISFGLRPPSADAVYGRIVEVAANEDREDDGELLEVKTLMEEFVERFANDPRRAEVESWLSDYQAFRLWRRLERAARRKGGFPSLSERQQAYVEAYRALKLDPGKARALFQSMDSIEVSEDAAEDDRDCGVSAKHWATRLKPDA